jgi:hypothetical protein
MAPEAIRSWEQRWDRFFVVELVVELHKRSEYRRAQGCKRRPRNG